MGNNSQIMKIFANEYKLPIISEDTHIWFFRTQSGQYYFDFYVNKFIALGWDLVSRELINDKKNSDKVKREKISNLYPDEQRPGLILGQIDTFYNKMQANDLIVIPSYGGREIAIGILGEIATAIKRAPNENEYNECTYKHKRNVTWLKRVDLWTDVYLSKVLRAQQTISNITEYAEMVYRNLHPCYISRDAVHLTLQKTTESDYSIQDNVTLQYAIIKITESLSQYFEIENEIRNIKIKTAVGSPGFIEILLPYIPISALAVACIFRTLVGKTKNDRGETATGIMALISKGNELLNDRWERRKTKAEIKQIEANTRKTYAETAQLESAKRKTEAETAQILAETDSIYIENSKGLSKKLEVVDEVTKCCAELNTAARNSGIRVEKQLDNAG